MKKSKLEPFFHRLLIAGSPWFTGVLTVLAAIGFYLGSGIELKLSLTDLLPEDHEAVQKFERLTEVVGGVGYFAVVLTSEDKKSHIQAAPAMIDDLKKSELVRDAFIDRERRFFVDRMLYYMPMEDLRDMEQNVKIQIRSARSSVIDLGLWEDEPKKEEKKEAFNGDMKKLAKKSAEISSLLTSKDKTQLLLMVKPSFDSTDLSKSEELIGVVEGAVTKHLPAGVTYQFGERYYKKVVQTKLIKRDIGVLGLLAIGLILLNLFAYLRDLRALFVIFFPILLSLGITMGVTRLFIGHINIITGFLMGILSGLGVDYAIHLYLRLPLERREPTSSHPDPVWRALHSAGQAIFVGAIAACFAFYLLCFSDFRAFAEFGFVCGSGILGVFICLMTTFSTTTRLFKLDTRELPQLKPLPWKFPVLPIPKGVVAVGLVTLGVMGLATQVRFEYDFEKMLQASQELVDVGETVGDIYGRSNVPAAIATPDYETAKAVEELLKEKYVPDVVSEVVSGATIIPKDQEAKARVIGRIKGRLAKISDRWIKRSMDVDADAVRTWVNAKPFTMVDLPTHLQDALRGKIQSGYLLYLYPAINLSNAHGVRTYARMVRDLEAEFPNILTGSDAVIFGDILDLINRDGSIVLLVILLAVGLFIWLNLRRWDDTLASYLPLVLAFPFGMGLMVLFGVKFDIFNICIIPAFVAIGIDIPIHLVHRAREASSGYKSVRDLAAASNLALMTTALGFGILIFADTGILRSLGWVALLGTFSIWWVGMFLLPAYLEWSHRRAGRGTASASPARTSGGSDVLSSDTVAARSSSPPPQA